MSQSEKFKTSTIDLKKRYTLADPIILQGIDNFLSLVAHQKLAFAKNNRSGKIFGRYSVVQSFCDIFDPLLVKLASQSAYVRDELLLNNISLPLTNILTTPDECNLYAFKFNNSAAHFDYLAERSHVQNNEITHNGESFKIIAEILYSIFSAIRTNKITWCKFCFRRSKIDSEYCQIHFPSKKSVQDTSYNKADRIFKSLDDAVIQMWARHRSRRKAGGDSFLLMANNAPPNGIYLNETAFFMSEETIAFVSDTIKKPWSEISSEWNNVIYIFPEISKKFIKPAQSFSTWEDFVSALFQVLQEPIETTRHPLWIINILKDAEVWFAAEGKFSDRRKNDTRDKVSELSQKGHSVDEIASELNLTPKYIAQLLRDN